MKIIIGALALLIALPAAAQADCCHDGRDCCEQGRKCCEGKDCCHHRGTHDQQRGHGAD